MVKLNARVSEVPAQLAHQGCTGNERSVSPGRNTGFVIDIELRFFDAVSGTCLARRAEFDARCKVTCLSVATQGYE